MAIVTDSRPLNVRVAEALGQNPVFVQKGAVVGKGPLVEHGNGWLSQHERTVLLEDAWVLLGEDGAPQPVPPYGEDSPEGWACTGPLISRFGIGLEVYTADAETGMSAGWATCWPWNPSCHSEEFSAQYGSSAPEAACNLILALAEAGRLPK